MWDKYSAVQLYWLSIYFANTPNADYGFDANAAITIIYEGKKIRVYQVAKLSRYFTIFGKHSWQFLRNNVQAMKAILEKI